MTVTRIWYSVHHPACVFERRTAHQLTTPNETPQEPDLRRGRLFEIFARDPFAPVETNAGRLSGRRELLQIKGTAEWIRTGDSHKLAFEARCYANAQCRVLALRACGNHGSCTVFALVPSGETNS